MEQGLDTVEIAIGDNLLIYPWIKKLVRINKCFTVQRALTMRQMLESSIRMSRYMHYTIAEKKQSIWIAQREGRAKDSNDVTQDSVLKMLSMGGDGDIITNLQELNIVPLSISYEYDPCDFLKAQEFQLKRDIPDFKKTTDDDLLNMQTGLLGYKGRVCFRMASCINEDLAKLDRTLPKPELFVAISALIDKRIHANYRILPIIMWLTTCCIMRRNLPTIIRRRIGNALQAILTPSWNVSRFPIKMWTSCVRSCC